MDWMIIGIFAGFFLTGIIAGVPLGRALERHSCRCPLDEITLQDILDAEVIEVPRSRRPL